MHLRHLGMLIWIVFASSSSSFAADSPPRSGSSVDEKNVLPERSTSPKTGVGRVGNEKSKTSTRGLGQQLAFEAIRQSSETENPKPDLAKDALARPIVAAMPGLKRCLPITNEVVSLATVKLSVGEAGEVSGVSVEVSPQNATSLEIERCMTPQVQEAFVGVTGVLGEYIYRIPVSRKSVSILGSLDKSIIRATISKEQPRTQACYERFRRGVSDRGTITVKWVVGADGAVREAAIIDSSFNVPEFEKCILDVVVTFGFPKPKGGGVVAVTYPFRFGGED